MDRALTEQLRAAMPLAATLGLELVAAAPEEVRARLAHRDDLTTAGGVLHGGTLMALADGAGAYCAFLNLPAGSGGTATIESKTNFFRAVPGGHVHSVSRPLHVGRTTIVVETDLFDDEERRVARVTQTQAVL
ncbi:MAG TPA: PaaI family thioesterase [Gaiellaceae bacterium]|nr:PaaI family thioesterase [Gaiellaceae bacterium]